ncbi:MAG: hypothetical protein ACOYM3_02005 [Terrimicrobiaceae bacterium]
MLTELLQREPDPLGDAFSRPEHPGTFAASILNGFREPHATGVSFSAPSLKTPYSSPKTSWIRIAPIR